MSDDRRHPSLQPVAARPDPGLGLKPGDPQYRAYVGPPEDYDLIGGLQFGLLFALGLREAHRIADVGCGSLRAGRLLIPYLAPGHYFGIEPNRWLVEEAVARELGPELCAHRRPVFAYADDFRLNRFGVAFDYVLAHSILSHTYPDLAATALEPIAEALAPDGILVATYLEGDGPGEGSGWLYPGCVAYSWLQVRDLVERSGLFGRPLDWPHPRQRWFLAGRPGRSAALSSLAARIQPSCRSAGGASATDE